MVEPPVVSRMQQRVALWQQGCNPQAVFLSCYLRMTSNMLTAIERREFEDPPWVDRLLHHFADYYFVALEAYERAPETAPAVWQLAHNSTRDSRTSPLQNLMLGVNAHINYDLVLTMVDLLRPEWPRLSETERARRYRDYTLVNEVIARTIDAVQDDVLEPDMPLMEIVDRLCGPLDELLVSRLIGNWRETVWQSACHLLDAQAEAEQSAILQRVEAHALRLGRWIYLRDGAPPIAGPG